MKFSYKEMLSIQEEVGELPEGVTHNLHHCKQGQGNDKLYVTNKGTATLFFCHHCGKKGAIFNKRSSYKAHRAKHDSIPSPPKSAYLPTDSTSNVSLWPIDAYMWPHKASLSDVDIEAMGMVWSERLGRVCIPIAFGGKYQGYIARKVRPDKEEPKYLTQSKDREHFIYACHIDPSSSVVVIVEDVLSAKRLSLAGYNSVAILGTSITQGLLNYLAETYDTYLIWMDNDNRQVKLKQVQVKERLSMFGDVTIIKTDKDPKEYSELEIKETLYGRV